MSDYEWSEYEGSEYEWSTSEEGSAISEDEDEDEEGFPLDCSLDGGPYDNPMRQLEKFLKKLSRNPSREYSVTLSHLVITRPLVTRLLPLILQSRVSSSSLHEVDHTVHSQGTTSVDTPVSLCEQVHFSASRFFSEADVRKSKHSNDVCTPDDKLRFLCALARFPLRVISCPEILSDLMTCSEMDHFEAQSLLVSQDTPLSDLEYIRLGAMIQRSIQLTDLALRLPFVDAPRAFYDSLANSVHVEMLHLNSTYIMEEISSQLFVGDDGNGVVECLLRNPQNQLLELDLSWTDLEDRHLIVIAQLLPSSKVKKIDFSCTRIGSCGLLEFARQTSKMHFLNKIALCRNPWEAAALEVREECGRALLHGIIENPSITWVDHLDKFPQGLPLRHQLSMNRTLQKLLKSSCPRSSEEHCIPDGLWPHILVRVEMCREEWEKRLPIDTVYFFLKTCPEIFSCLNREHSQPVARHL